MFICHKCKSEFCTPQDLSRHLERATCYEMEASGVYVVDDMKSMLFECVGVWRKYLILQVHGTPMLVERTRCTRHEREVCA